MPAAAEHAVGPADVRGAHWGDCPVTMATAVTYAPVLRASPAFGDVVIPLKES